MAKIKSIQPQIETTRTKETSLNDLTPEEKKLVDLIANIIVDSTLKIASEQKKDIKDIEGSDPKL